MKKVLLSILSLALTAFAFWPAGGVKVVETPNAIQNPQMVYIEDGSVIISWEADRQIYCQKLDTIGVLHWDASGIRVCLNDSTQLDHHMVTDGQDVWFVWQDERADDGDIYAQKISGSTGQRLWGDQGKAVCVKADRQRLQKCSTLPVGGFAVTWVDYSVEPRDVAVQRFEVDGEALWKPNGIFITRQTNGGSYPTVLPSGKAVVDVWGGLREGETEGAYFAQRIDSEGNFLWDTQAVLIEYVVDFNGVVTDNSGGCIILFDTGDGYAVQRTDSLGQVLWNPGGVKFFEPTVHLKTNLESTLLPQEPTKGLISDNESGCFVWWEWNDLLQLQHVLSSGNLEWTSAGVVYWSQVQDEKIGGSTKLCLDCNGGVMAIFDNLVAGPETTIPQGLFVQRIDYDGETVFDDNGIEICVENGHRPTINNIATAIPGGIILTWSDNRHSPNYGLYSQIVDTTGKVGSAAEEEPLPVNTQPSLEIAESVLSHAVSLRYTLPAGEIGTIKFFDATGRFIKSHSLNQQKEVITLDIRGYPSGVYFVQLQTSKNKSISKKMLILH